MRGGLSTDTICVLKIVCAELLWMIPFSKIWRHRVDTRHIIHWYKYGYSRIDMQQSTHTHIHTHTHTHICAHTNTHACKHNHMYKHVRTHRLVAELGSFSCSLPKAKLTPQQHKSSPKKSWRSCTQVRANSFQLRAEVWPRSFLPAHRTCLCWPAVNLWWPSH